MKKTFLRVKIITEQHGYILGLVLVFFIIFTIMGLAFINMGSFERVQTFNYYEKLKAFYHAGGGIHKALWLINRVSAEQGTFTDSTVNVVYDSINQIITAIGQADNFQKTIQVTLGTSSSWPYAMFTEKKVKFNEENISGTITGDIHANETVTIGNGISINGTITEAPPTVNAPTVDWNFFKNQAIAAGQYVTTDKTFDSSGSPYSGVWYVKKKAKIKSNAIINGTVVAEEDCKIEGDNITITASPLNYPAILSKENIKIDKDNSITITGFIYSDKDFKIDHESNVTIIGALTASKDIKCDKEVNINITYNSNYASNMTGITFNLSNGADLKIVSWQEL